MPYSDEEYPDQPLWQSVLLFCCKGMIEGIMVILFLWLLVQVLFTRQLEVHLQILLLVGLITFCLSLVLGCIVCCKKSQICCMTEKAAVTSASAPGEPGVLAQAPDPFGAAGPSLQLYEDAPEYPSTFTSPAPSEREFTSVPFPNQIQSEPEENQQATSYFSLRRLSSPLLTAPLYKPIHPSRASLPTLPRLGLFTKTCEALQRRCTVTGDARAYDEHSRLNSPKAASCSKPEKPIPLDQLNYGSNSNRKQPSSPRPCIHFTMAFSPEQEILTVTVLNLTGMLPRLDDVIVLASLPPLHPCPTQASAPRSLSPKTNSKVLLLKVSSVKELQTCKLRLKVSAWEVQSLKGRALGEAEVECGGRDWRAEHPFHFMTELLLNQTIFVALQYQALTHCIKVTILRTENLHQLIPTSGAADDQIMIHLHHEGVAIRRAAGGSCTTGDTSFLFELPPGDIHQLPLTREFIVMQHQLLSAAKVAGRFFIGAEAADAGRAHWKDVCSLQGEQAQWHTVQTEPQPHSDSSTEKKPV